MSETFEPLTVPELLEKGAAYIEEHGLHKGEFWPRAGEVQADDATRRGLPACAMGAMKIIAGSDGSSPLVSKAGIRLASHIGGAVPPWNDAPSRTAGQVADTMRACAVAERAGS